MNAYAHTASPDPFYTECDVEISKEAIRVSSRVSFRRGLVDPPERFWQRIEWLLSLIDRLNGIPTSRIEYAEPPYFYRFNRHTSRAITSTRLRRRVVSMRRTVTGTRNWRRR